MVVQKSCPQARYGIWAFLVEIVSLINGFYIKKENRLWESVKY